MKIAILGTRGIPNNYGGFEQNAENLSVYWVKKGHEVVVYNPDEHPYKGKEWNGVKIKHVFSKESKFGIGGIFVYDFLCLKDAVKQNFDIILNLGYVPSALFFYLKKKTRAKFVTNMDGLECKRSKWNSILKKFIKFCEKRAVYLSDYLIADNPGIKDYYVKNYKLKNITFIPYGARLFDNPNMDFLREFDLEPYSYYMLVSRLEPENNIEMILDGYILSKNKEPFIVVGGLRNKYAKYLLRKYKNIESIRFVGGIYNYEKLSSLRWYSKLYFHGHSVGGTNPSLLEAMASNSYIVAHDNPFNRYVLGEEAFYFKTPEDIAKIIKKYTDEFRDVFIQKNRRKIKEIYNWNRVSAEYLKVFKSLCEEG
ncbi:protein of unknown function DUF1972 [Thermodesulfatator indicus DSM 15286]|uniref:DUF1972 domain-containing protein n=1 Tax=Thermodesulfatator indicus (strain DSM 15286 / JCM 11887 / CIR29812) TaxID=667014 RepID=F8AC55_THEID|nr:DUF1972 domain-containing protein [Thermodesulfatator indicus]AEH44610.1 protein of unknown function DUF1972 [Thermodesulfatator indicus DSM 15286]